MNIRCVAVVFAIALVSPAPLPAGSPEPEPERMTTQPVEKPWSFSIATYGWMQSLQGTSGVLGIQSDIDIPFSDVIKKLNIGFMATMELRYKRWGILADNVYADLRGSADTPFNIFFSKADYELKQFLGNYALSYRFVDTPKFKLDGYAGARVNYIDGEITLIGNRLPLPPNFPPFIVANRDFGGSKTWVDPIVGARLVVPISGPFFLRMGGDVGGFGVSSDFTWQAYGTVGVNVARNIAIGIGYRGLGTDYTSGGFKYDVVAHGPVIGSEIRF